MNTRAPDGAIDAQWQIWDFARNLSAFVDDNRTTYNLGKKNIKPLLSCAWLKQWRKQHIFHIYCIWIISFHISLPATYSSCSSKDMGHRIELRFLPGDRFYSVWNGAYMEIEGRNEISTFVPMCGQVQMSWTVSGGKLQKSFGLKHDSFLLGPENTLNLPAWDKACWTCYVLILAFIKLDEMKKHCKILKADC